MIYLLADVGSTFTKVLAVDFEKEEILGFAKSFTTIITDIYIGFENAVNLLKKDIGDIKFDKVLVSSSAKGGLKMVSVGLVTDLSAKAGKLAATSAGAKLFNVYSYELSKDDLLEIENLNTEIVLLTGGIDGGNKEVVIKNATALGEIKGDFTIVYAGNNKCKKDIENAVGGKKDLRFATNVMPVFGKLDIEPAKECIRQLFIEKIIQAKGLQKLQNEVHQDIIPTPLAFLNGLAIFEKEFGNILAFDMGGATCDVYSINEGNPKRDKVALVGLKEPYNKRSVEGDIGMRYSLSFFLEDRVIKFIEKETGFKYEDIEKYLKYCIEKPDYLPTNDIEKAIEISVVKFGIDESTKRHCGYLESTYTLVGEVFMQHGKDLTDTKTIIGAGGAIVNAIDPKDVLSAALYKIEDDKALKPLNAQFVIDEKNCITSLGLLFKEEDYIKEKGKKIFLKYLNIL
ncbi:MAG: methylaspartate mutase accessory protein GlmL [Lachnospirales bacterium]